MARLTAHIVSVGLAPLLLLTACAGTGPADHPTTGTGGKTDAMGNAGRGGTTGAGGATGPAGTMGTAATTGAGGRGGASGSVGATGGVGRAGGPGTAGTTGAAGRGGTTGAAGASGTGGRGGTTGAGGTNGAGGTGGPGGSNVPPIATHCTAPLPVGTAPVDTSSATNVVGTGTAASCTFAALSAAVTKGGVIKFNCGAAPVTIPVTATLVVSRTADTTIDGGHVVTLDGQGAVQILRMNGIDWMTNNARLTLQNLTVVNGKTTPTAVIPTAPAPCSQGYNDGEGGAVYIRDGNLTVIDSVFMHNRGAPRGPDTGGGAIYITGSKYGALIVGGVFTDNAAANAGAVGALFATLNIYNSVFKNNRATGDGANSDDATMCPNNMNNGQHEVGSGGNGGAIYQDGGAATNVLLCGIDVETNAAGTGAFGGGVFMTSNDFSGTITVQDSVITGNTGGSWTQVMSGPSLGTAFGVNAKSSSVVGSTLQGVK